jgi:muramidase (phage lysozyme)
MANAFKGILAAGVVASIAWAFREYQKGIDAQEPEFVITPAASTPAPQRSNSLFGTFLGNFAGTLFDSVPAPIQDAVRTVAPTWTPAATNGGGGTGPILAIIRQHESRGNYNIVWGGISAADQPPRPLTQMTIGQVLAWQDSIDAKYMSEAAGAYQILEDTLRGLYASAGLSTSSLFNRENQDRLGVALLERRGLSRYRRGALNDVQFAQNLSMEWASFPAQTRDKRGRAATGQSYYAGDGLNASLTSKAAVISAVRSI